MLTFCYPEPVGSFYSKILVSIFEKIWIANSIVSFAMHCDLYFLIEDWLCLSLCLLHINDDSIQVHGCFFIALWTPKLMSTHVLNFNRGCEKIAGLCVRSRMAFTKTRCFLAWNFIRAQDQSFQAVKSMGGFKWKLMIVWKWWNQKLWFNVCQHSVLFGSLNIRYWGKMALAWWSNWPLMLTSCWAEPDSCFFWL